MINLSVKYVFRKLNPSCPSKTNIHKDFVGAGAMKAAERFNTSFIASAQLHDRATGASSQILVTTSMKAADRLRHN